MCAIKNNPDVNPRDFEIYHLLLPSNWTKHGWVFLNFKGFLTLKEVPKKSDKFYKFQNG